MKFLLFGGHKTASLKQCLQAALGGFVGGCVVWSEKQFNVIEMTINDNVILLVPQAWEVWENLGSMSIYYYKKLEKYS